MACIIAACACLLLTGRLSAGVVISEIMYNPQGSDNDSAGIDYTFTREWVELYNTDPAPIDLSGWQFGDSQDGTWAAAFPTGTTIGPGQALVVTGDTDSFDANWGLGINRIEVAAFPNLANSPSPTNETAALRMPNGLGGYTMVDQVNYDDELGWPTATGSDGNSIYLLPGALTAAANDVGTNWKPSSAGVYQARFVNAGAQGENHGSPGLVATQAQAAFAPSPNATWSMVVLPDTQNYSKSSVNLPIFSQMTTWIRDHREQYKIELVMQEGDIVNQNSQETPTSGDQTANQQWANARAAMSILDGHLPYIMAVGNHDLGTTSAQNRNTQFNDYFQPSQNPLIDPAQGGILAGVQEPGRLENAYFELHAPDGRDLLIFSLEFWPTQAVVNWANQIAALPQYQNHTAVLLTHSYLNWDNERTDADPGNYGVGGDSHDGEQLWQELVKLNENFEMTFSGHVGGDGVGYLESTGVNGNTVHQMMINAQFETNGGNGWMRLVEFLNDGRTARIRTFSPFLNLYRTTATNAYEITLTQLPELIGDFDGDRDVDSEDLADWAAGFGVGSTESQGDADGDGDVDGADFLVWQRHVTTYSIASATSQPVPEPASWLLLAAGLTALTAARVRKPQHLHVFDARR